MNRNDAKQDFKRGGLNFPDIENSFKAFKFSWLRRLWGGEGLWVKLFALAIRPISIVKNVQNFLCNLNMIEINKGISKIKNPFWKSVLSTVDPIWKNYQRKYPQIIGNSNVWGSTFLVSYQGPLLPTTCPTLSSQTRYYRDFIVTRDNQTRLMNPDELIDTYTDVPRGEAVQALEHLETATFRQSIELGQMDLQMPMRPGFVSLLNISRKGCAKWAALLRPLFGTTCSIRKFETKWTGVLGRPLSVQFWDQNYKNTSMIFWSNKLKLFHFKIVRGIIMTN